MPARKCRKTATVEAFELTHENFSEVNTWTGNKMSIRESGAIVIETLEGTMENIVPGDFIMKGARGEFYRCARDIFLETYEFVDNVPEYDDEFWRNYTGPTFGRL